MSTPHGPEFGPNDAAARVSLRRVTTGLASGGFGSSLRLNLVGATRLGDAVRRTGR